MKNSKILLLCAGLVTLLLGSCNKNDENTPSGPGDGSSSYNVSMTDAPGPYRAVYVDIQAVEIVKSDGKTQMLNVHTGVYNLLRFSNGIDTMIASGSVSASSVEQIRLVLGPNNSVVTSDGISHALSTPSAQQSGLKIQVHHTLQGGAAYNVLLDFDAHESIVVSGTDYILKPVIRSVESSSHGSISGAVSVSGAATLVTAKSGSFSFTSVVNASGQFKISGVPPGDYSLIVSPVLPHNSTTLSNVHVTAGSNSNVGIISI